MCSSHSLSFTLGVLGRCGGGRRWMVGCSPTGHLTRPVAPSVILSLPSTLEIDPVYLTPDLFFSQLFSTAWNLPFPQSFAVELSCVVLCCGQFLGSLHTSEGVLSESNVQLHLRTCPGS